MRGKMLSILIIFNLIVVSISFLSVSSFPESISTETTTGTPSPLAVNAITNVNELQNMRDNLTGDFYLANDIDCSVTKTWNSGLGFEPIGDNSNRFQGTFDGRDFNINNLYINNISINIGLFGVTNTGTKITNVSLENVEINGTSNVAALVGTFRGTMSNCSATGNITADTGASAGLVAVSYGDIYNSHTKCNVYGVNNVGGLVGSLEAAIVDNCYAIGLVTGNWQVGGLLGNNKGEVNNSYTTCDVTAINNIGGLIGYSTGTIVVNSSYATGKLTGTQDDIGGLVGLLNSGVLINNSYSTSSITGRSRLGGLVGSNFNSIIKNSYAIGEVNGTGNNIGGLVGGNSGTSMIDKCYALGTINGSINIGGLVGNNNGGEIENTYCKGSVTGVDNVGAHTGRNWNNGDINNSYAIGHVLGSTVNIGGFVGINSANIKDCFFDNITTGQTDNYANGSNTIDMKQKVTFTAALWDFTNIWVIIENVTYPYLKDLYDIPRFTSLNIGPAIEDSAYLESLPIWKYPDDNKLTFSYSTDAVSWLSMDLDGILSGSPTNNDVGSYWFNVNATDLFGNFSEKNFTLEVLNTNDAPTITTIELPNATEDSIYIFTLTGIDIDPTGDILNWSIDTNAGWLKINSSSGELNGTPDNDAVGTNWVNITVDDGNGGSQRKDYILTVLNVNDPPEITTTDVTTTNEDTLYIVDYEGNDIDPTGDILTWSLVTDANWLEINSSTGVLSGTPNNTEVGTYDVNVTLSDGNGGLDFSQFELTVQNVNDPPEITTLKIKNATEDQSYKMHLDGFDIDPTNSIFDWEILSDTAWLSINGSSGNLSGTPENSDVGKHWVNVTLFDGEGGDAWANYTFSVINVNDPPVITTDYVGTAKEDEAYIVEYEADDIDPTNDILTWALITNASDWLTMNSSTGELNGTPRAGDAGIYWINITVNDNKGGFDWQNFSLTVKPKPIIPNENPKILTKNILTAKVGEKYSVNYEATDDHTNASDLVWSWDSDASWLSFDDSSGELYGTPTEEDVGSYWVRISVADTEDGLASTNFTVTVQKSDKPQVNRKPKLSNGKINPTKGDTDTDFTFSLIFTDEDNDSGEVWILIDGLKFKMIKDSGDSDFTDGVKYTYKTKLAEGEHNYYFNATDGTDYATGDASTPTTSDSAKSTPIVQKVETVDEVAVFVAMVVVIIVIIALLGFAIRRRPPVVSIEEKKEEEKEEESFECPECGAKVLISLVECPECGADLPEEPSMEELDDEELNEKELEEDEPDDVALENEKLEE